MAKEVAYASGMRGGEKPATLKNGAESLTVRPAENGFIVEVYWPPKKGKDYMYTPPKPAIFKTAEEVGEYVEQCLGVKDDDK